MLTSEIGRALDRPIHHRERRLPLRGSVRFFHDVKHVHVQFEHADWARMKRRLKAEKTLLSPWLRGLVAAELARADDATNGMKKEPLRA